MVRRLLILLLIYICIVIFPVGRININTANIFQTKVFAEDAPTLKVNSINFDNSDSIIFLGTSGNEETTDFKITKKVLTEPDRIFFDIENAIITFPNSTYEIKNSKLTKLRIAQNSTEPNIVRIVIWNSTNYDTSQIKVLRIKNNIIIKLNSEKPVQKYLTQVYKETSLSAVDFYEKAVVIPEEKPKMEVSDEIFNKVQDAFKNEDKELVRPNIEQKQARLKSRFFLEKVLPKDGNILLSGIGVINIERPFRLSDPSRIVFDLPNTIVIQELRDKEIKLSDTETIKIGQFEPSKARIVIKTTTPQLYVPIYSSNLQTLLIANSNKLSGVNLADTLSELSYFKEQKVNDSTNVVNITFSKPVIYSLKREGDYMNMIVYNLTNFNAASFNELAQNNKNGFIVKQINANTYKFSFPININTYVDCYEALDASQLRFVFTVKPSVIQPADNTKPSQTEVKPIKLDKQSLKKEKPRKLSKKEQAMLNRVKNKVIIIDPGHGGNDTGALRGNILEKDLTLAIALKVKDELKEKGFKNVIMTRTSDTTLALSDRVDIANNYNADLFVSIHINSSVKTEINGIETHYYWDKGYDLAKTLHKELMANIPAMDRGLFKSKFYVINHTEAPAVLLELGFISNEEERAMLTSDKRQEDSAKAIANGIYNYIVEQEKQNGQ